MKFHTNDSNFRPLTLTVETAGEAAILMGIIGPLPPSKMMEAAERYAEASEEDAQNIANLYSELSTCRMWNDF